ncbi:outer membrane beta-barrel protein [Thermodesulfobacteriota bacterium]
MIMNWKCLCCACFMAVLFLLIFSPAKANRAHIQPVLYSGIENNSNFWKSALNEVSVNTYYVKPGAILGYETPKTEVFFDGTVNFYWYDGQDTPPPGVREASDDNYIGATAELTANYQATRRINLGLLDLFYITRDPARSDVNSNSINRDKYTINYFEPNIYYEISGKFGLMSKYRNTTTDYEKDLEDSKENRGIFNLFYYLNSRQRAYLDYSVWKRTYDQQTVDYTSNLVSLNYEHQFNYLSLEAGAGYHNRSFDLTGLEDMDVFPWHVEIKRQDPDSTRRTTRSFLSLDIGQDMNNDGTGNQYFTATFFRFEGAYRFFEKLEASIYAAYQMSDYEFEVREDDTYLASGRLAYLVTDYLTIGFEGGKENRDSNIDGLDFDDTFFMLTLDIEYDFGTR